MYKYPCFDSSIFIGGINNEIKSKVRRGAVYRYLLRKARLGEFRPFIATALISEVFKSSKGQSLTEGLDEFLAVINEEDLFMPIELDRHTALNAHELCRKHAGKLRPFDAIHLACALSAECDYLLTWDKGLCKVTHDRIKICAPMIYSPDLLDDPEDATDEEQDEWNRNNPKRADPYDLMLRDGEGI